jgi:uncharacterized damage-inducible protein DinB
MKHLLTFAVSLAAVSSAFAQPAGYRGEVIKELNGLEMKFVKLAGAIPASKYGYHPGGDDVRTVAEVFLHVAGANYNIPRLIGTQPPKSFNPNGYEKSTTDPRMITTELKQSFAHMRKAIEAMPDADLEKKLKLFGEDATYRYVLLFMPRHLAEHLGQMIAYARGVGVVPPWTEEQMQRQKQQKKSD